MVAKPTMPYVRNQPLLYVLDKTPIQYYNTNCKLQMIIKGKLTLNSKVMQTHGLFTNCLVFTSHSPWKVGCLISLFYLLLQAVH